MRRRLAPMLAMACLTACFTAGLASCSMSEEQEVATGRQNAQQVNATLPLVRDQVVAEYVQGLGMAIAKGTPRAGLDWRFFVIDSPDVNAFALPGGFIYVNRGLIERAAELDELAGALGHEIGHVVRRHSVKQMEKASGANTVVGITCSLTSLCDNGVARAAIQVGGAALFAKYSRQDETEADSEAVVNLVRAGIDPHGIPVLFERLVEERRTAPMRIEAFFASHPMEEDRIVATRRQIDALEPRIFQGLQRNIVSYGVFKERLAALPAARTGSPRSPAGR